jgi:uncharacterized membrane protein
MDLLLGIVLRWAHMVSMAAALGGAIYLVAALKPACAVLNPEERERLSEAAAARFRAWAIAIALALLASGLYNFFTKPAFAPGYHMWFGIKVLLALHVLAVLLLNTLPGRGAARRLRAATGALLSGLVIVAISGYLRWISR